MANFISDFFENRGWLGLVQQNATTGALEVNGVAVTGATSYTMAQFLALDVADYANYTILISDIPSVHSAVNGVLVRANAAGTGWIWSETPSFTVAQIASLGITALIASGWRVFISNIGQRGSYWYSNGTRFNLDQDAVTLLNLTSDIVMTGHPTAIKLVKQYAIPTIDGKSVWGNGDLIEISQVVEKTGIVDRLYSYIYIGTNVLALDATETNNSISVLPSGDVTNLVVSAITRIRRDSSTQVKLMTGQNQLSGGAISNTKATPVTVTNLDTTQSYIDAAAKFIDTGTTDSAITLTGYTVRLISAGAA